MLQLLSTLIILLYAFAATIMISSILVFITNWKLNSISLIGAIISGCFMGQLNITIISHYPIWLICAILSITFVLLQWSIIKTSNNIFRKK